MNYTQAKTRADILKAMANPVRVLIVHALHEGDRCVGDLHRLAGIAQSNISRHLEKLKKAGLISDHRRGMKVYYHLETPCILKAFECAVEVTQQESLRKQRLVKAG